MPVVLRAFHAFGGAVCCGRRGLCVMCIVVPVYEPILTSEDTDRVMCNFC